MSCYKYISKKQRQQKRIKTKIIVYFLVLIFIVTFVYLAYMFYKKSMTPTLLTLAEIKVKAQTALIINQSVVESISDGIEYDTFVKVTVDQSNKVSLVSVNSAQINIMAQATAILVQQKLASISSVDVEIPWGTLSGIPLLSNKGDIVSIQVSPIPTTTCSFTSDFIDAGLNQTLHRIYINVNTVIDLVMPSSHRVIETVTPVLLCESIIVGDIPQLYIDGGFVL